MNVIRGYLTRTDKKVIKNIIEANLTSARTKLKDYLLAEENGIYTVAITRRPIIPEHFGDKRMSSEFVTTFTL